MFHETLVRRHLAELMRFVHKETEQGLALACKIISGIPTWDVDPNVY